SSMSIAIEGSERTGVAVVSPNFSLWLQAEASETAARTSTAKARESMDLTSDAGNLTRNATHDPDRGRARPGKNRRIPLDESGHDLDGTAEAEADRELRRGGRREGRGEEQRARPALLCARRVEPLVRLEATGERPEHEARALARDLALAERAPRDERQETGRA